MGMWTAVVVVSIVFILAGIVTDKRKMRRGDEITDELKKLHTKVNGLDEELRDRVATLERIITNPKEDLKRQFEHLDKAS